jgi:hypothetical protein
VVCRIYDIEGGTLEDYDSVFRRVGMDKPEGAHVHIAGQTGGGFKVIEVWDSPEHIERFMAGLDRAMEDTDIGLSEAELPAPTITEFEIHNLDWLG